MDKLGFFLVRVADRGLSVHLIRTGRDTPALDDADPRLVLLTCTSGDLPASPLGVVATHPLGHMTPGPVIWPSVVRQRVRDDWRLFACLELGARHVRVPESDLEDQSERARLPVLRGEGVSVTASWVWSPRAHTAHVADLPVTASSAAQRELLDEVEVVFPGGPLPDPACLAQIRQLRECELPVALSTAIRMAPVGPHYHGRTRVGYRPDELPALDEWLGRHDTAVDRVVCRVYAGDPPWQVMQALRAMFPLRHIGVVDLALDLPDAEAHTHAAIVAEAMFAAAALPRARLWLAPLVDLDRSMDVASGLLDRLSNPRPAFTAARTLNTILFASPPPEPYLPVDVPSDLATGRVLALAAAAKRLWLVLPRGAKNVPQEWGSGGLPPGNTPTNCGGFVGHSNHRAVGRRLAAFLTEQQPQGLHAATRGESHSLACYRLVEGTSERVAATAEAVIRVIDDSPGPTVLVTES
ncbi:MAG: hypothetical protein HY332_23620 [Chloroflexi bacterium]|nr:hypothetical protein [Chloroflexota bacterium]